MSYFSDANFEKNKLLTFYRQLVSSTEVVISNSKGNLVVGNDSGLSHSAYPNIMKASRGEAPIRGVPGERNGGHRPALFPSSMGSAGLSGSCGSL